MIVSLFNLHVLYMQDEVNPQRWTSNKLTIFCFPIRSTGHQIQYANPMDVFLDIQQNPHGQEVFF